MDFSDVLVHIKNGERVQRTGWNGKGMWIELQRPDAQSKMTLPYIFMFTADKNLVPWLASQTDILAGDWQVVPISRNPPLCSAADWIVLAPITNSKDLP